MLKGNLQPLKRFFKFRLEKKLRIGSKPAVLPFARVRNF